MRDGAPRPLCFESVVHRLRAVSGDAESLNGFRAMLLEHCKLEDPPLRRKLVVLIRGSSLLLGGRPVLDTLLCRPGQVLTDITEALSRHLNQYNSHNPYDKIVFLFKTWSQADVLLKWIKLAECEVCIKY